MARKPDPWIATYSFRIGDVFPAGDIHARYVMRLSMALGDLRIAAQYATRDRQRNAERLYFIRLTASHLRELVMLLDPPNPQVVPKVDEFVLALPRGTKPTRSEIRAVHRRAIKQLAAVMRGRPDITVERRRSRAVAWPYPAEGDGRRGPRTASVGRRSTTSWLAAPTAAAAACGYGDGRGRA